MILLYIFSALVIIIINILSGELSTLFLSIIIYIVGLLYSIKVPTEKRNYSIKLFFVVYTVYVISAYIFSISFQNGQHFLLSDPLSFIERSNFYNPNYDNFSALYNSYIGFSDSNELYNLYLKYMVFLGNNYLGGTNIFYITLLHSCFGILSSAVLFRVLLLSFNDRKAYYYTLIFSIFSVIHFYSSVIIRDIIILYFYLLGLEIVIQRFSKKRLIFLIFYCIVILGIRLYSGLYFFTFIILYIYIHLKESRFRFISMLLFFLFLVLIILSSQFLLDLSINELNIYDQYSTTRSQDLGGLSSYLINLPNGIKQIVLTLYSQFHPFPPYAPLKDASTFSQLYMSSVVFLYSIFWAFIFFPLLVLLFSKHCFLKMSLLDKLLLIISIMFITINTIQIDIRRMMPVYPILYMIYLKVRYENFNYRT